MNPFGTFDMPSDSQRKANNALGICCISLVFLCESAVAHYHRPSSASTFVWAIEGAIAIGALVYYVRHKAKAAAATS